MAQPQVPDLAPATLPSGLPRNWPYSTPADLEALPCRTVSVGPFNPQRYRFRPNAIKNSKYEPWNFLFLFLFEEFDPRSRVANVYFLCICCLQCIPLISNTGGLPTTLIPLTVIVLVDGVFAALEDIARHKADRLANASKTQVYNAVSKTFLEVQWSQLQVGDYIKVRSREAIPADMLIMETAPSSAALDALDATGAAAAGALSDGTCYIETRSLDGETNLKVRHAIRLCANDINNNTATTTVTYFTAKKSQIEMEHPNNLVSSFIGVFEWEDHSNSSLGGTQRCPIDPNNLLLRGCTLRNSDWVCGIVLNTGHDTKIMMTGSGTGTGKRQTRKHSSLEIALSREVKVIILILLLVGLTGSIGQSVWTITAQMSGSESEPYYLNLALSPAVQWVVSFFYILLLHAPIIPVSLYISVALSRFGQAYFMQQDLEMYHLDTDTPALVRTAALNDELGRISHVFSDKTGTLTSNVMDFRKASVHGVLYGQGITEIGRAACKLQGRDVGADVLAMEDLARRNAVPHVAFACNRFAEDWLNTGGNSQQQQQQQRGRIREFFVSLAVCHDAILEAMGNQLFRVSASNPDDEALICAADYFGFTFTGRRLAQVNTASQVRNNHSNSNSITGTENNSEGSANINVNQRLENSLSNVDEASIKSTNNNNIINSNGSGPKAIAIGSTTVVVTVDETLGDRARVFQHARDNGFYPSNSQSQLQQSQRNRKDSWHSQGSNASSNPGSAPVLSPGSPDSPRMSPRSSSITIRRTSDANSQPPRAYSPPVPNNGTINSNGNSNSYGNIHDGTGTREKEHEALQFTVLRTLAFTSQRKRMSVIGQFQSTRNPTNDFHDASSTVVVYCKGADSALTTRLHTTEPQSEADREYLSALKRSLDHAEELADEGLRCLLVGKRILSIADYRAWSLRYDAALSDIVEIERRNIDDTGESLIARLEDEMERELTLLGVTAIEDRLQEGVPETIELLLSAGIKTWVLTGDKEETAVNIAMACNLLHPDSHMRTIVVNSKTAPNPQALLELLEKELAILKREEQEEIEQDGIVNISRRKSGNTNMNASNCRLAGALPRALVIDGPSLLMVLRPFGVAIGGSLSEKFNSVKSHGSKKVFPDKQANNAINIFDKQHNDHNSSNSSDGNAAVKTSQLPAASHAPTLIKAFLALTEQCASVVACRVSPDQKREIVALVRRHAPTAVTLAIGDGANDVAMIKEAHVGVGISGEEGLQAVNASDFAIAQFRFLSPLLWKHGRSNHIRLAGIICYIFYKNILCNIAMFWFNIHNGWSSQKMFTEIALQGYSLVYTLLPAFYYAVMDRDLAAAYVQQFPALYRECFTGAYFNSRRFWALMSSSITESVLVSLLPYKLMSAGSDGSAQSFWGIGMVTFTSIVVLAQWKLMLFQHQLNVVVMVLMLLSVGAWFFAAYLASVFLVIDFDFHDMLLHVVGSPLAWLTGIVVVVIVVVKDLFVIEVAKIVRPELSRAVIEMAAIQGAKQSAAKMRVGVDKVDG